MVLKLLLISGMIFTSTACQSLKKIKDKNVGDGAICSESLARIKDKTDIGSLNLIKKMFYRGCFSETISAIQYARRKFRDSQISLTRDAMEVVAFEGTVTDYVMESYERTYLSILGVRSYMALGKFEDAKIELRVAYQESVAMIDTQGQDKINLLLMAILWERLGERESALPLYRRVQELSGKSHDKFWEFAELGIHKENAFEKMKIYELGDMPEMLLNLSAAPEFRYPPYEKVNEKNQRIIDYTKNMIVSCKDRFGDVVSTAEWLKFLSDRVLKLDSAKYQIKKMIRLPMTILYTTTVAAAGAYLTVLAAKTPGADPRLPFGMAAMTVVAAKDTYNAGMAPDLRYWDSLPQALLFTESEDGLELSSCLENYRNEKWFSSRQFL